jgi:4-alpha-glucanotransferase
MDTVASNTQWDKIGRRKHHGIALPLFSIRNPDSHGIGEYLDLLPLISWCKEIGFDVIQLLPLNDSGHDTSPYSAHSAMALHPIFLSLGALPFAEEFHDELEAMKAYNDSDRVDYHTVLEAKEAFFARYVKRALPEFRKRADYNEFLKEEWLDGYARYKVLKEQNQDKPWWEWSKSQEIIDKDALDYHKVLQFLCFSQLMQVKNAAEEQGVFIKGDIPILINPDSADVWEHPEIFDRTHSAGAPPDMYSKEGQNWGFPVYRWDVLEKTDYKFWKQRLLLAQKLYHIYRLDHLVGFFRIWAIPEGKKGHEGVFVPHDENQWIAQGEKILRMMLKTSQMLPIAEDLGTVPTSVRECMKRLGVCGTKVMRWERRYDSDRSFIKPKDYPTLSMTTLSTHDSEPLEEWWDNAPDEAEEFAETLDIPYSTLLYPETRAAVLKESHRTNSLFHINLLQEYLDVFTELTWENPSDDRINIPGKILDSNWTYRFLPTLQEITAHEGLKAFMKALS